MHANSDSTPTPHERPAHARAFASPLHSAQAHAWAATDAMPSPKAVPA
jgi:hypothetical protein